MSVNRNDVPFLYFVCVCVRTCHMHIIHIIMQFGLWD